jgi:predicted heme/steroid binding protein
MRPKVCILCFRYQLIFKYKGAFQMSRYLGATLGIVFLCFQAFAVSASSNVTTASDTIKQTADIKAAAPAACSTQTAQTAVATTDSLPSLTIAELAAFDGANGKPAYVAVDGTIYDVTGVNAWKKGKHESGKAGTDISKLIQNSPHGKAVLKKRTVVGKLVDKK